MLCFVFDVVALPGVGWVVWNLMFVFCGLISQIVFKLIGVLLCFYLGLFVFRVFGLLLIVVCLTAFCCLATLGFDALVCLSTID